MLGNIRQGSSLFLLLWIGQEHSRYRVRPRMDPVVDVFLLLLRVDQRHHPDFFPPHTIRPLLPLVERSHSRNHVCVVLCDPSDLLGLSGQVGSLGCQKRWSRRWILLWHSWNHRTMAKLPSSYLRQLLVLLLGVRAVLHHYLDSLHPLPLLLHQGGTLWERASY